MWLYVQFCFSSKEIPSASCVQQVDCSVSIIVQIGQVFVDLQAGLRAGLAGPIQHGAECMLKLFVHQAPPPAAPTTPSPSPTSTPP